MAKETLSGWFDSSSLSRSDHPSMRKPRMPGPRLRGLVRSSLTMTDGNCNFCQTVPLPLRQTHPGTCLERLIHVTQKLKIAIYRSAEEMPLIRPLWDRLYASGKY